MIRRSSWHRRGVKVARLWHGEGLSDCQCEVQATSVPGLTWAYMCGAGDENRTRTTSLEGWGSTIELHPQSTSAVTDAGS